MIRIRKAGDRGHFDYGWLDTFHTFSFGSYSDPNHMGFRSLRVMNEDVVQPAKGFGTHPHHDMEIVTYVLEGALEHKDSMGNGEVLRAGEFQRMSAGTGITHSEFNPSPSLPVHLYQIWLRPADVGIRGHMGSDGSGSTKASRTRAHRRLPIPSVPEPLAAPSISGQMSATPWLRQPAAHGKPVNMRGAGS